MMEDADAFMRKAMEVLLTALLLQDTQNLLLVRKAITDELIRRGQDLRRTRRTRQ